MYNDSLDFVFPYSMRGNFDQPLEGAASAYSPDGTAAGEGRQDGESKGRQDSGQAGRQDGPAQADNNEGDVPLALQQAILRGQQCCARVPERIVSEKSANAYNATFVLMWGSGSLDPFSSGIAYNTYYHRRAALHYGAVIAIRKLIRRALAAVEREDDFAVADFTHKLRDLLNKVEIAFDQAPPGEPHVLPWEAPPSRFHQLADETTPKRGANSKRDVLGKLKENWDEDFWDKAVEVKSQYLLVLAVKLTIPVRTEDMVPGDRPGGFSQGVILRLLDPHRLEIVVKPCKSRGGVYGTRVTTITVDPTLAGKPAKYLAERCGEAGDYLVVSVESKNAVRKALKVLGEKALPRGSETITPSVLRNQLISDLKKTLGAGEEVAAASGHSTDRTQSRYGHYQHGRRRKGYIAIASERIPRTGNVERASQISNSKVSRRKA
jgi:hypothetical protein